MGKAHIIVRVRGEDGRWRAARPDDRGERRYIVRWRIAGRDSRLRHGGSRRTRREAEARRRYIDDCLAAGLMPDTHPGRVAEVAPSIDQLVRRHIAARVDVDERTRQNYGYDLARLPASMRALRPSELTSDELQRWINEAVAGTRWGAGAILDTVGLLRAALRRAGVEPNPAEPGRITTPVYRSPEVRPPTAAELLALSGRLLDHHRNLLCVIEGSGMRVGEATRLLGRDVDREGSRILVRRERTKRTAGGAGERWIPLRPATLALIPERDPGRRAMGIEAHTFREALRAACRRKPALTNVNPKSLRHRHASRLVAQGIPITLVKQRIGHSRASMTLDVYSHVLLEPETDPALDLADLIGGQGLT